MTDSPGHEDRPGPGPSPYDTYASSGLRFLVEVIAWTAGPWAAADLAGNGWVAVPALLVLLAVPSVFSTPGDKHQVVVATPGPIRVLLELLLAAVAVVGAWIVWPAWIAGVVTAIVAAATVTGWPRTAWLLSGAPPVGGSAA